MNKIIWAFVLLLCLPLNFAAQVTGMWKVVDDNDGVAKSIVEITEVNGKYQGRVTKILPSSKRTHCENCKGDLKGKQLTGMVIMYDLEKIPNGAKNGKILDPSTGNFFSCSLELKDKDTLKLRGYLGTPAVGKTSYWYRVK